MKRVRWSNTLGPFSGQKSKNNLFTKSHVIGILHFWKILSVVIWFSFVVARWCCSAVFPVFLLHFFCVLCMHFPLPPVFSLSLYTASVSHPLTFTAARRYLFLTLLSFYHILHLTKCVQFLVVHHTFLVFQLCILCIIYCFSRNVFTWRAHKHTEPPNCG